MGMKARKPRGVEMRAHLESDDYAVLTSKECPPFRQTFMYEGTSRYLLPWPGPQLEPGECKRVRVIIEEVED